MKTRAVVVWFSGPIYVEGRGKRPRTRLDLTVVVNLQAEPARHVVDRMLESLPTGHPMQDPTAGVMAGFVEAVGKMKAQMDGAPTPGLRWVGDCAEFQLADGSLCVIPRDWIAWVELGPEVEG
jgi:hypothetical protein